ncbi:MAG TPA: protein translocase subunit SecD [Bryobacteraceae bacterium]|nr:protein translocase subunit SecD [Bryobacteraceae bacterium]
MPSNLRWKWLLILVVVTGCIIGLTGLPTSKQALLDKWAQSIRLGLDLKGGSHMVLQVQIQDAFKAEADQTMERIKTALASKQLSYAAIDRNDPTTIETAGSVAIQISGIPLTSMSDVSNVVKETAGEQWNVASAGMGAYRLTMRKEAEIAFRQETLTQTIETLNRKVNGLGVAEASVQQRGGTDGEAEILVQLPGVDDPARVKSILQTSAMLELCGVKGGPYASQQDAMAAHNGVLPIGTRLVQGSSRSTEGATWWLLTRSPVVTGRDLRDARPQQNTEGPGWETGFVLTQDAAGRFGRFTEANIQNRLAIVLDNVVLSAPVIQSKISDQGRITGAATQEEASDLALNLRAGALPAGLKVIEERVVGPSLGADSIRRGLTAGLVGLALVIASMILYYRGAGWNAVLALMLNTILTISALSYIDATWTLPGIAGLVLSIGMAVDSNVLIFERIKEEIRNGKAVPGAIAAGFSRAFVTILDTHVTTVVASAFLFMFGTGPVRGFAVTLVIGLIANLFTAVFVSRAIFDIQIWRKPQFKTLSIWPRSGSRELFEQPNIAFLNKRYLTLGLSALMIAISIGSLVYHGGIEYGLDFRGGTLTEVRFSPKPSIDELRSVLGSKIQGEISVQETPGTGEFIIGTQIADEQTLEKSREAIRATLTEKYSNAGGKLDLNNATPTALSEALGETDTSPESLTARILSFRDRERGGLIRDWNDLKQVSGVTPQVVETLKAKAALGTFQIRSVEMVGPRAGEQLRRQAVLATLGALAGMLLYIAFRFRMVAGVAAVVATIHDVVITLGLFSLMGREVNLNIIAALLTLIGYSMNDKIVVFDRVRENQNQPRRKGSSFLDLVNESINQTLSRTLLTAGPTLLACLALYFLGGDVLNGIAFALLIGIVVGTYSSIFVASALMVLWHEYKEKHQNSSGRKPAMAGVER